MPIRWPSKYDWCRAISGEWLLKRRRNWAEEGFHQSLTTTHSSLNHLPHPRRPHRQSLQGHRFHACIA